MKRKTPPISVCLTKRTFDASELITKIAPLEIFRRKNQIFTQYGDEIICKSEKSEIGVMDKIVPYF